MFDKLAISNIHKELYTSCYVSSKGSNLAMEEMRSQEIKFAEPQLNICVMYLNVNEEHELHEESFEQM